MIKVNLASRKQAGFSGGAGEGTSANPFTMIKNVSAEELKEFPLVGIGLALAVYFGGTWYLNSYKEEKIAEVNVKIRGVESEISAINAELASSKGFEQQKKSLETDEFTIKTKIEIIEKLVSGRKDSLKLMKNLSELLPSKLWLSTFNLNSTDISVTGRAADFTDVNEFAQKMQETSFYAEVENPQLEKKPEGKSEIVEFTIKAKRKAEGSGG